MRWKVVVCTHEAAVLPVDKVAVHMPQGQIWQAAGVTRMPLFSLSTMLSSSVNALRNAVETYVDKCVDAISSLPCQRGRRVVAVAVAK